jgi:hypothetical protein
VIATNNNSNPATPDESAQYAVISSRRLQWDTLFWQTPMLALTGEAFLFSIALGSSTSKTGRIVASVLALVIALACLQALAGQRVSELTDAEWLENYERVHELDVVHGTAWRDSRKLIIDEGRQSRNPIDKAVAILRSVRTLTVWFLTLGIVAVAALAVLLITIAHPALLAL